MNEIERLQNLLQKLNLLLTPDSEKFGCFYDDKSKDAYCAPDKNGVYKNLRDCKEKCENNQLIQSYDQALLT